MTQKTIEKIRQIIRCFETGTVSGADYGAYVTFNDGPGNRKQITYGAAQTTEFGNLKTLLEMYIVAKGKYWREFQDVIHLVGVRSNDTLANNPEFVRLLKEAGKDSAMHKVQDRFFMISYFNPALQWFERNGFKLPLSMLVIYDSYTHSGSVLAFLRNSFAEKVPADGGDEKKWVEAYVNARDHWLETHTGRPILRNTDYRTDSFIYAIREDNWMLDKPFQVVNYPDPQELKNPQLRQVIP
jgi:chitosanase